MPTNLDFASKEFPNRLVFLFNVLQTLPRPPPHTHFNLKSSRNQYYKPNLEVIQVLLSYGQILMLYLRHIITLHLPICTIDQERPQCKYFQLTNSMSTSNNTPILANNFMVYIVLVLGTIWTIFAVANGTEKFGQIWIRDFGNFYKVTNIGLALSM